MEHRFGWARRASRTTLRWCIRNLNMNNRSEESFFFFLMDEGIISRDEGRSFLKQWGRI